GLSELLQMEDLPVQVSEDVRKIQEAAQRAAKVVQNLLSFARTHEPEKRYLDVASIVDQALELKAHDFNFENIRVATNHSSSVPATMVDEHQFIQVMLNILTNAEQSIKAKRGPGEIKIATQFVKNMIRISISDDGLGIPASNLHSIFDPFFSTKEVGEGTGLGLSICYGIVREHGGELWVESTPGYGATFHIELPVLPDATLVQTRSTDTACGPVAGRRILVVDDEPVVRNFLSRALSADGHDVESASDGEAAWKLIQGSRFDVILLDLRMPGVDGQELYKLITDLSPEMSKRVVFITGDTASADTRRFLDSTASPVLSKPFTLEAVRQLL
ncbi:MAG: ATP-binding protein, partial [Dehalococcoidia bacterium]